MSPCHVHRTDECMEGGATMRGDVVEEATRRPPPLRGSGGGRTLFLLLVVFLTTAACTSPSWRSQYLTDQVNAATQEEIEQRLGPPTVKKKLGTDETVWIYRFGSNAMYVAAPSASGAVMIGTWNCREYVLQFDSDKILRKWRGEQC